MRKSIAKHIGYPIQDVVKGTNILRIKDFLSDSQYWEKKKMQEYQLEKLKKLIRHAYTNVPYYNELFNKYNIKPGDINDFQDMRKIPILTKEIARKENHKLISNTIIYNRLRTGKTGGTTGPSLTIRRDTATRSFTWGAYYRWYDWVGVEIGDPILGIWGASAVLDLSKKKMLKEKFARWIQNIYMANSFNMNEETLPRIMKIIQKRHPKFIKGYVSALLQLANYIEDINHKFKYPIAISTTSETLLPHLREYLKKIFHCDIYDQYGGGECESIAFECSKHNGLHITSEHVFLEILDDNDNDMKTGIGRVVVTDLDNYAMPIIRYENGDAAEFQTKYCTCGINLPLLKAVYGRKADTITLANGSKVHGVFFTDILFELDTEQEKKVNRFQAYQEKPGEIEFRLESHYKIDDFFLKQLTQILNKYFNKVEINIYEKLEHDSSGKFRYVISKTP